MKKKEYERPEVELWVQTVTHNLLDTLSTEIYLEDWELEDLEFEEID